MNNTVTHGLFVIAMSGVPTYEKVDILGWWNSRVSSICFEVLFVTTKIKIKEKLE